MRLPIFPVLLLIAQTTNALVTLQTIKNLTSLTDDYRNRILDTGEVYSHGQQAPLGGGGEDGEEVEETVTASLNALCSHLLHELEKPLSSLHQDPLSDSQCTAVITSYHSLLASTTTFLHAIQERQMRWAWSTQSPAFDAVGWLQGLWASRSRNSQNRSFIEQQMSLYGATTCFGERKEVLRRGVEVVEYLNDLVDTFR